MNPDIVAFFKVLEVCPDASADDVAGLLDKTLRRCPSPLECRKLILRFRRQMPCLAHQVSLQLPHFSPPV